MMKKAPPYLTREILLTTSLRIHPASPDDANMLAEIRVESMRPSLEAINRFDAVRARERFLKSFTFHDTFILQIQNEIAGFYVLKSYTDHLYLDHFYIKTRFQGRGIGKHVLKSIQAHAAGTSKPIKLIALVESPANAFYRSMGFLLKRVEDVDNHYLWEP
ncbi:MULTISPECIES: GNAT family N-acetyltransferase [Kosakonia]|jgi:ribosomal protein S18 acetylase RimI-like enzyme|uniref:GNAT family N-acetyltransferase n=1 Tax=Kosakonia TaxID=1330547 RepID=UPI001F375AAE|nr:MULTISPECIES: GNAT family N-acetyltransferase [Kosakonia]